MASVRSSSIVKTKVTMIGNKLLKCCEKPKANDSLYLGAHPRDNSSKDSRAVWMNTWGVLPSCVCGLHTPLEWGTHMVAIPPSSDSSSPFPSTVIRKSIPKRNTQTTLVPQHCSASLHIVFSVATPLPAHLPGVCCHLCDIMTSKRKSKVGTVVSACILSTQEAGAGGLPRVWITEWDSVFKNLQ